MAEEDRGLYGSARVSLSPTREELTKLALLATSALVSLAVGVFMLIGFIWL